MAFYLKISLLVIIFSKEISTVKKNKENRWGFYGHKLINRTAVFLLPEEMLAFYKLNIQFIEDNAVNPDARRYLIEGEAPRHYIDLDMYHETDIDSIPVNWHEAVNKYSEDALNAYGIVPWYIYLMSKKLTKAFEIKNSQQILKLSAEIGHYIADANVPLHTTSNYNGQKSNQYGIHGLWESRLVELYSKDYDLFFDDARYLDYPLKTAWSAVRNAHLALDSVMLFEKLTTEKISDEKKFGFEERNNMTIKVYSTKFSQAYHEALNGQVERRLKASIKMVADFWFTCWVNAGQPDLSEMLNDRLSEEFKAIEQNERLNSKKAPQVKSRKHETIE